VPEALVNRTGEGEEEKSATHSATHSQKSVPQYIC
jgi:hypothetical protein